MVGVLCLLGGFKGQQQQGAPAAEGGQQPQQQQRTDLCKPRAFLRFLYLIEATADNTASTHDLAAVMHRPGHQYAGTRTTRKSKIITPPTHEPQVSTQAATAVNGGELLLLGPTLRKALASWKCPQGKEGCAGDLAASS